MTEYKLYINGEYCDGETGRKADSINPYSQEVYASVYQASAEDAEKEPSCYLG